MKKLKFHHVAYKRGYISRKDKRTSEEILKAGEGCPYNGKFGEGYTVETPCYNTTQYHLITYFIFE